MKKSLARIGRWMKRRGGRYAAVAAIGLAVAATALYLLRNRLLEHFASSRIERFERERGVSVDYAALRLEGLGDVVVERLTVVPEGADTLLSLGYASVSLDWWSLLFGEPDVREVCCRSLRLTAVKSGAGANYSFLFGGGGSSSAPARRDYGQQADRLLGLLFRLLPERAEVEDLQVSYERDGRLLGVRLPRFREEEGNFSEEAEIFNAACGDYQYPLGTPVTVGKRETTQGTDYRFSAQSQDAQGHNVMATIYVTVSNEAGTKPEFTEVVR